MKARIREILAARGREDSGFTLIELLVVMIIIGIIAAIAIPVFMNQKSKAFDTSVKSDLKSMATNAETYYADNNNYGTGTAPADAAGVFGSIHSTGNSFDVYVFSGSTPGYIIYGKNASSNAIFVLSSFSGSNAQKSTITSFPTGTISTTLPTGETVTINAPGATATNYAKNF